ncbi:putative origin recognition complex subunit [Erysiphe necator]|uniref:Putative origin recognition complex subunit n=1 Tax=Uncinula necator TaxID=52586 RepID=A0A0B1P1Q5_UNCNE|nr:putative origin recognition complex subunit [Erysiphe necator]
MTISRKRSQAQFNYEQDEISVENDRRAKRGKANTWETANLLPKYNSQKSAKKSAIVNSGTLATPELKIAKPKVREKDIYDFTSSDSEDCRQTRQKNSRSSSKKRLISKIDVCEKDPGAFVDRENFVKPPKNSKTISRNLNSSNSSRKGRNASFDAVNRRKKESDETPFLSKKSTPVVEIISSGLSKNSGTQRSRRNLPKIEGLIYSTNATKITDLDKPQFSSLRKRKNISTESTAKKSALAVFIPSSQSKSIHSDPKKRRIENKSPEPEELSEYTTKSIFNSDKIKLLGPKKTVTTDTRNETDLGFKDLPVTVVAKKKQNKKKPTSNVVSISASLEDDTACEVCRRYDSKKKNPMLLCDGCDSGYHVKCIGLAKEPSSDLWFCEKCKPDVTYVPREELSQLKSSDAASDIPNFGLHLKRMQQIILDKLTGRIPLKLINLEVEMQKVHQIVHQTVLAGEGNSMLIIGSRGTGKSCLVDHVISDISNEHRENFHVVRLNGFIHTDDRIALKEIWRQLGREMRVEDDDPMMKSGHHADILMTLLALLSDPSHMSETEPNQTATSVIFILDEFDHFTIHHRQTLLYNLFDIAQSKKAPILVLGLTTKVDAAEMLEKRVKSRFSHRYVQLSLPRSLPAFWEACKGGLSISEFEAEKKSKEFMLTAGYQEFMSYWNAMIENLYTKDKFFIDHIKSIFYRAKSVPIFLSSCIIPISNLSTKRPLLCGAAFQSNGILLSEPDSKLHIVQGLSDLELALLIAAARLDVILDTDMCNFAMAYEEYSSLTSRHKIQTSNSGAKAIGAKVWGRQVSLDAWEKLAQYELLVPIMASSSGSIFSTAGHGRDYSAVGRMWKVDIALEEIPGSVENMSKVMVKWCREI